MHDLPDPRPFMWADIAPYALGTGLLLFIVILLLGFQSYNESLMDDEVEEEAPDKWLSSHCVTPMYGPDACAEDFASDRADGEEARTLPPLYPWKPVGPMVNRMAGVVLDLEKN